MFSNQQHGPPFVHWTTSTRFYFKKNKTCFVLSLFSDIFQLNTLVFELRAIEKKWSWPKWPRQALELAKRDTVQLLLQRFQLLAPSLLSNSSLKNEAGNDLVSRPKTRLTHYSDQKTQKSLGYWYTLQVYIWYINAIVIYNVLFIDSLTCKPWNSYTAWRFFRGENIGVNVRLRLSLAHVFLGEHQRMSLREQWQPPKFDNDVQQNGEGHDFKRTTTWWFAYGFSVHPMWDVFACFCNTSVLG